jgi:hypothetical protein
MLLLIWTVIVYQVGPASFLRYKQYVDVFLTCADNTYEIWTNDKNNDGFRKARTGKLPTGIQQITFADMSMFIHFLNVAVSFCYSW